MISLLTGAMLVFRVGAVSLVAPAAPQDQDIALESGVDLEDAKKLVAAFTGISQARRLTTLSVMQELK